jgi:hypothetical protein
MDHGETFMEHKLPRRNLSRLKQICIREKEVIIFLLRIGKTLKRKKEGKKERRKEGKKERRKEGKKERNK